MHLEAGCVSCLGSGESKLVFEEMVPHESELSGLLCATELVEDEKLPDVSGLSGPLRAIISSRKAKGWLIAN